MNSKLHIEAQRPVVIGVAGGTGSGKTTLATAVQSNLGSDRAVTVSQDSPTADGYTWDEVKKFEAMREMCSFTETR